MLVSTVGASGNPTEEPTVNVLTAYIGFVTMNNGSAFTIEMLKELVPLLPTLSVIVNAYVVLLSACVGVPDICPVDELKLNPPILLLSSSYNTYGFAPPVALTG